MQRFVSRVATEAGLQNHTDESKVSGTLLYFVEPIPHFPILIGARTTDETVIVDLIHFHPGSSTTPAYDKLDSTISAGLIQRLGTRLTKPNYDAFIPTPTPNAEQGVAPNRSLPPSQKTTSPARGSED